MGQGHRRRDDDTAPDGDDLQHAMRELSAELRAQQEELEEAAEHIERANRSLPEVALEFLYRGDVIRVAVGQRTWVGVVTHVGTGVMTLQTPAGAVIDLAYEGLSSIRVVERTTSEKRLSWEGATCRPSKARWEWWPVRTSSFEPETGPSGWCP